jgi:tetratricopeptide (TPR) repeat protein
VLQGRHDEALAELSVATWIDPNDAKAHAATGQVYARLLKYPEAITALRRALMLDPSLREARYALGTVLMRVGRTAEAKTELEAFGRQQADAEARGRREFEIDALRRQAATHALAGDLTQAVAKYEDVVRLDPQSGRSHRDLGVTLLRARRGDEAIEHLQRAQQIEETADGFALLADAYAATGNADASARMREAYQRGVRRALMDRLRGLLK